MSGPFLMEVKTVNEPAIEFDDSEEAQELRAKIVLKAKRDMRNKAFLAKHPLIAKSIMNASKPEEPKSKPKLEDPKPKQEQPKVEQPKPEQQKVEQPKPEQSKVEQPKPEQPKVEQPKVEQQKPEQPKPKLEQQNQSSTNVIRASNGRWF